MTVLRREKLGPASDDVAQVHPRAGQVGHEIAGESTSRSNSDRSQDQAQAGVARERVLLWETCDLLTSMLHAWTKVRLARIGPRMLVLTDQLRRLGAAE